MKKNKEIYIKREFIDEFFGEKVEYVKIKDNNGITILFNNDNKLIIKNFVNTQEIIEKYISMYNKNEFIDTMFKELDDRIYNLQKEIEQHGLYINNIENINSYKKYKDMVD